MGIDALTSAFATLPTPAVGTANVPRERRESASSSESAQPSVPKVVFNPRSHFDASAGVFVMEYRNADTGEVERQFPDENQLRAYANAKRLEAEPAAETTVPDAPAPAAAPPQGGATAPSPVRIQV
ncbi:MAG TPA: hypothetical protein VD860_08450 [Azospirillum sp.]|nr:hypothetical protein [Azospirillum sp.]